MVRTLQVAWVRFGELRSRMPRDVAKKDKIVLINK